MAHCSGVHPNITACKMFLFSALIFPRLPFLVFITFYSFCGFSCPAAMATTRKLHAQSSLSTFGELSVAFTAPFLFF